MRFRYVMYWLPLTVPDVRDIRNKYRECFAGTEYTHACVVPIVASMYAYVVPPLLIEMLPTLDPDRIVAEFMRRKLFVVVTVAVPLSYTISASAS